MQRDGGWRLSGRRLRSRGGNAHWHRDGRGRRRGRRLAGGCGRTLHRARRRRIGSRSGLRRLFDWSPGFPSGSPRGRPFLLWRSRPPRRSGLAGRHSRRTPQLGIVGRLGCWISQAGFGDRNLLDDLLPLQHAIAGTNAAYLGQELSNRLVDLVRIAFQWFQPKQSIMRRRPLPTGKAQPVAVGIE